MVTVHLPTPRMHALPGVREAGPAPHSPSIVWKQNLKYSRPHFKKQASVFICCNVQTSLEGLDLAPLSWVWAVCTEEECFIKLALAPIYSSLPKFLIVASLADRYPKLLSPFEASLKATTMEDGLTSQAHVRRGGMNPTCLPGRDEEDVNWMMKK